MKRILILSTVLFAFTACKKLYDNDLSAVMNYKIETAFDEMTNISDQAITGNMVYYKSGEVISVKPGEKPATLKTPCNVIITIDTLNSVKTITVDYGTTNCDCNDGKTRRGKIITTFSGQYIAQGTVITHTPVDYYVNDIRIDGTKTVTNMGLNSSGQPYFNVQINGTATQTNGEVLTYASTRVRTWVQGFNTLANRFDDQYEISGTATGSFSSGGGYTVQTTSPLRINVGCGFPVSGTLELTPQYKPVRIVDYGQGTCDYTFTVTVNGNVYTIN
ncbi:MAG: hypothetical protein K9G31_09445 [Crocinitomicaceae bacterium]|nr:hypothetical protein [Crocinitomicaceae bacterium]